MKQVSWIFVFILLFSLAEASIFSDKLNVPTDYATNHTQTITLPSASNVRVTIPENFTYISSDGTLGTGEITWSGVTSASYILQSDVNLTEGDVRHSLVYVNNVSYGDFLFTVVPDNKIGDCKAELGHGESNWLSTPYLPAGEESSLFNMVRVFLLSSYYNEDALNTSVTCIFPSFHVLVSQGNYGTLIQHNSDNITAKFYWDNAGKNWFRVAPLEQELRDTVIGDTYNITCSDVEYYYSTGRVSTPLTCNQFTFANTTPLDISTYDFSRGIFYNITNKENYTLYDVELKWMLDTGDYKVQTIKELKPGEFYQAELTLDGTDWINLQVTFTPEWYKNALGKHPYYQYYRRQYSINTERPQIYEVVVTEFLEEGNRVFMADLPDLNCNEVHTAVLYVTDFFGNPLDADEEPWVYIKSMGGSVQESFQTSKMDTGVYRWYYETQNSILQGNKMYETQVLTVVKGQTIIRNGYWRYGPCTTTTTQNQTVKVQGNTGGGNNPPLTVTQTPISESNEITGSVVSTTLGGTCGMYGVKGQFLNLCWWEWLLVSLLTIAILKAIWYWSVSIKNIFKRIWGFINMTDDGYKYPHYKNAKGWKVK